MTGKIPSINDILNNANAENESKIKKNVPDFSSRINPAAADASQQASTAENSNVSLQESTSEFEKSKSEADEIINKYSQHVRFDTDKNSATGSLRDSLTAQMDKDKDLLSYFSNTQPVGKSKKVNELYDLINTAVQTNDIKPNLNPIEESHFSPVTDFVKPVLSKQQKLFDNTETISFPTQSDASVAEFDEDYAKLGEKIENGEISFTEDVDEHQVTLIDENADIIQPNLTKDKNFEEKDEKDINLLLALNMMDENSETVPDKLRDIYNNESVMKASGRKVKKNEVKKPEFEYTTREQNAEIDELLRRRIKKSRGQFIAVVIFAVFILYLELATKTSQFHFEYLRPGRYGMLYALVDLQLLFFIVVTIIDNLKNGFMGLIKRKPTPESVLVVMIFFATAYSVVTFFLDGSAQLYGLMNFPAAAAAVCSTFIKYLQAKKDDRCFKTIASKSPKYVSEKLDSTAKEGAEFYKYLLENSELYTTKKTVFVDGFFRRLNTRPEGEDLFGFLIAIIILAGGTLFGVQMFQGNDFYAAFTSFTKLLMFSMPLSAFFIIAFPVITANFAAKKLGSAFIGNAVGEEYSDASVISFADTEVYPATLVKISSIKVYGDYRIDMIITDLARVFSFIGGPLKTVTVNMISGETLDIKNSRLIESTSDGICVVMNGREMFLGQKSYLRRYRFETPYDEGDDKFESADGSIMYVTLNEKLIAKVYIKYKVSSQFNSLLRDLYKAGMCVGIKTIDPNINSSLLERTVKFTKCPISILKANDVSDVEEKSDRVDSGIVTNASLHTFLKMFIVCDKIRHVTKSNGIINILSIVLSFFVVFFLAMTGDLATLPSYYPVLYQILWLLPISVISFLL